MDNNQSHESTEITTQEKNKDEQDLPQLTEAIRKKIDDGAKNTESFSHPARIYRLPEELRKLKEGAYTPRLIAIGPLHRNDKHLQKPMQDVKMSYANHLLCRLTENAEAPKLTEHHRLWALQDCVGEMKACIGEAKKCYKGEVTVDEEMMLVDGCFILELFYRFYLYLKSQPKEATGEGDHDGSSNVSKLGASTLALSTPLLQASSGQASSGPNKEERPKGRMNRMNRAPAALARTSSALPKPDPIFDSNLTWIAAQHDLLLLENQIPFFVLERLFPHTLAKITDKTLTDLVDLYFCNMMSPEGEREMYHHILATPSEFVVPIHGNKMLNGKEEEEKKYYHILHYIHEYYLPCEKEENKKIEGIEFMPSPSELMPSASELDFAGIKFVGAEAKGKDIFKVTFNEPKKGLFWWCHLASFKIPTLGIYDATESFLRNLIALEQCVPGVSQHFTSYAFLMDMLVNSEKDIEVLVKAGVLRNYLGGSKDATNLFNNLCKEVVLGDFFFAKMCKEANEYSGYFWPKNFAYVKRTYFASPWTFIAFCVGFIAFVISVTSFVLSLL